MSENEKAARRRQPGTASNKTTKTIGRIYHIEKRAATTASDRAPDRKLSQAALRKECASEAASPSGFSHVVDLSATARRKQICEQQKKAFERFVGEADGAEAERRRRLVQEMTVGAARAQAIKAKAREAYKAIVRLRDLTGSEFVRQQQLCARLWEEHAALLRAADGGGEGR